MLLLLVCQLQKAAPNEDEEGEEQKAAPNEEKKGSSFTSFSMLIVI